MENNLPPMPEGISFVDSVVNFCRQQEKLNEQIISLLKEAKEIIINQEKRITVLEFEKVAIDIPIHYGPNGKGGLH